MALDQTSFAAALKQHYTDWKIENLVYKNNPFLAMVPKYEAFGGDVLKLPIIHGNPQNRSATFSRAVAGTSTSALKAFLLTRAKNYSIAEIENETILASEGDANAFLRAATVEIDGAMTALSNDLAVSLYRSSVGSIGQISSTTTMSGAVATLASPEDVVNFEVGMKIVAATTNTGTPTIKDSSGTENVLSVIAVDRSAGTVTFSAAMDSFASNDWAQSDYLYIQGDVNSKLSGLQAWLPYGSNRATELAASFFGVTRSADGTRLGGVAYNGTAQSIEEALIDASATVAREGGTPDKCFVNYKEYRNLVKALGSKVQYTDVKAGSDGAIGFQGIVINGAKGNIEVIADKNCPVGKGFMVQMDTWKLASLKKAANLFETDGLKMLRSATNDSLQIRCFSYAQLGCTAPGWNAQIAFA